MTHPLNPENPEEIPDRELADLDTHMQALFTADAAPTDLADRTLAHLSRSRLSWSALHPFVTRAPLAIAATLALAATGYYAQDVLKPHQQNKLVATANGPRALPTTQPAANHDQDGQNVLYADGHVEGTETDFAERQKDGLAKISRDRAVAALVKDSRRLTEEGRYAEAEKVVNQIKVIDPKNDYAAGVGQILFDRKSLTAQRENHERFDRGWVEQFNRVDASRTALGEILTYPADWPDLSARRDQSVRGGADIDGDGAGKDSLKPYFGVGDRAREENKKSNESLASNAPATSAPQSFRPADRFAGARGTEFDQKLKEVGKKLDASKPGSSPNLGMSINGGVTMNGPAAATLDSRAFAMKSEDQKAAPGQQNQQGAQGQAMDGVAVKNDPKPAPDENDTQVVRQSPKVIRSGTVAFEVDSFDSSLMTVTKLVIEDGGFVASTDSNKLPNGKTRGLIVVRVPPDRLDAFILKLRGLGDLKSQQIAAQDVGKQYTDIESQLRAARAMETRLLEMIAKGQGAIKELLAAEKELGTWREKIEKLEGEKRYYDNLISMSTLQITMTERDIKAAAGAVEAEVVNAGVETDDVLGARTQLLKAIDDAKGRVIASDLNQLQGGQLAANVTAEVPSEQAGPLVDRLKQLGRVARLDVDRKQTTVDGSAPPTPGAHVEKKPTKLVIGLYNLANVAPRTSVTLNLASSDVEQSYRASLERINKAGGRVIASSLSRPGDTNVTASINFETAATEADAVAGDLRALGDVTRLQQTDNPDLQNTTLAKRGFVMQIVSLAQVQPRQAFVVNIAARDVSASYQKLLAMAQKNAVKITQSTLEERDRENMLGRLDVEIPAKSIGEWEQLLTASGDTLTRNAGRLPDGENVVDSKTRYTLAVMPADRLPPRKSTMATIEVGKNVEGASGNIQVLAEQLGGRIVDASVTREASGKQQSRVVVDVPLAKQAEVLAQLRTAGDTTSLSTSQSAQAPDGALGRARFDVTFTTGEALVGADDGFWASIVSGFGTSLRGLAWSVHLIVIGLCLVLPWVAVLWVGWKLVQRRRRTRAVVA